MRKAAGWARRLMVDRRCETGGLFLRLLDNLQRAGRLGGVSAGIGRHQEPLDVVADAAGILVTAHIIIQAQGVSPAQGAGTVALLPAALQTWHGPSQLTACLEKKQNLIRPPRHFPTIRVN